MLYNNLQSIQYGTLFFFFVHSILIGLRQRSEITIVVCWHVLKQLPSCSLISMPQGTQDLRYII